MDAKQTVTPQFKAEDSTVLLVNIDGQEGKTLQVAKCNCPSDARFIARACDSHDDLVKALDFILNGEGTDLSGKLTEAGGKMASAALAKAGAI